MVVVFTFIRAAVVASLAFASLAAAGPALAAGQGSLPDPVPCPGCYSPALDTSWQWQLSGTLNTTIDVQMYDIDMFDNSRAAVTQLHADGRAVVCYIDAGTWENWRPDAGRFPAPVMGAPNGWPGERWLNVRKLGVLRPIMRHRLDLCERKGFDAVEFDNVDGYQNHTGFPITGSDQLRYNTWLANQAHRRGLSAALKNDLGQVRNLLPYFDLALNEQCFQYRECWKLKRFVNDGKAVFGVEYQLHTSEFCPRANNMNFNFLKKRLSLKVWRVACR